MLLIGAYAKRTCAACGRVSSLRELVISREDAQHQTAITDGIGVIENPIGQPVMKCEIVVSLDEGPSCVFKEANPLVWRNRHRRTSIV